MGRWFSNEVEAFLLVVCVVATLAALVRVRNRHVRRSPLRMHALHISNRPSSRPVDSIVEFGAHFQTIERYDGLDASKIDVTSEPRIRVYYDHSFQTRRWESASRHAHSRRMSDDEIVRCISHRNIWELAMSRKYERLIVLENEVTPCRNFKRRFRQALASAPSGWDILYLGYTHTSSAFGPEVAPHIRAINEHMFDVEITSYVLSARGLRRLLRILPIDRPIDAFLARQVNTHALQGYVVHPQLVTSAATDDERVQW